MHCHLHWIGAGEEGLVRLVEEGEVWLWRGVGAVCVGVVKGEFIR